MKCFNHREIDAIGLCRSCGKSLCPECYVLVGESISCKGSCEAKVRILNRMLEQNAQIIAKSNQAMMSAAKYSLVMGVIFIGFGVWQLSVGSAFLPAFLLAIGTGSLVHGILRSRKSTQYPNEPLDDNPAQD